MRIQLIVGGLFICCAAPAAAAEATATRPDRGPRSHIQTVSEIAAAERAPWAGLTTARAPTVLRQQLALERGAGLIVEEVAAGSVADTAGLRQHDVLVSLDGQLLVLPEQLTTLLAESGADAPCSFRLVRGGKETVVALRPQDAGKPVVIPVQSPAGRGLLKPAASTLAMLSPKSVPPPPTRNPMRPAAVSGTVVQLPDGSLLQRDPDFSIKLTMGSETKLLVKDARGWIVFNGSIDTPAQRSLVPIGVRSRVEALEKLTDQKHLIAGPVAATQTPTAPPTVKIGTLGIEPIKVR